MEKSETRFLLLEKKRQISLDLFAWRQRKQTILKWKFSTKKEEEQLKLTGPRCLGIVQDNRLVSLFSCFSSLLKEFTHTSSLKFQNTTTAAVMVVTILSRILKTEKGEKKNKNRVEKKTEQEQ